MYVKTNPMGFITDGECPNCADRRITLYYPVGENLLARCNHCGCLFNISPNEEQVYYSGKKNEEVERKNENFKMFLFWIAFFAAMFFLFIFASPII